MDLISKEQYVEKYFFCASNNAFYPFSMKDDYESAGSWPSSGVEVSEDVFLNFTSKHNENKVLGSDEQGMPAWKEIPPLSQEEAIECAEADRQSRILAANDFINIKQWLGKAALGRLNDLDKEQYNRWLDYLDLLVALDVSTAPVVNWPEQPN